MEEIYQKILLEQENIKKLKLSNNEFIFDMLYFTQIRNLEGKNPKYFLNQFPFIKNFEKLFHYYSEFLNLIDFSIDAQLTEEIIKNDIYQPSFTRPK